MQPKNYLVLSNNICRKFLINFKDYRVVNDKIRYHQLKKVVEDYPQKTIVFKESLYTLTNSQKNNIYTILKMRGITSINITSDIEDAIYCDYIYVMNNFELVIEGNTSTVLKEEKLLKRIGYGLPFVTDIGVQLNCYGILNKQYIDMESMVDDLWN